MSKTLSTPSGDRLAESRTARIGWRVYITAGAVLFALLCAFILTRYTTYRKVQEKFYGQALVPAKDAFDFHLIDQNGKLFQLSQLHGKLVLFSFGFIHCPNICPTTLSDLSKIYRALPEKDQGKVQVLFISVDPQRDRPEILKEYVPYFDASFVGLTGNSDQIAETAKAYGASYEIVHTPGEDPDVYFVNHSTYIYLINPDGKWQLIYNFDQLRDTEKIVADIERIHVCK